MQIVAECTSVRDTAERLRSTPVDLLLLDIHLGPYLGFRVLDDVPTAAVPLVVFVTAYDQYAVRAFEKNAVDYLLKPVQEERLAIALDRVRRRLHAGLSAELRAEIRAALEPLQRPFLQSAASPASPRFVAEKDGTLHLLDAHDVETIETNGNYVVLRTQESEFSIRSPLQAVEDALPGGAFLRLNRSVMVNVSFIARIERDAQGVFSFSMRSGRQVTVGRSYQHSISQLIRAQGLLVRGPIRTP